MIFANFSSMFLQFSNIARVLSGLLHHCTVLSFKSLQVLHQSHFQFMLKYIVLLVKAVCNFHMFLSQFQVGNRGKVMYKSPLNNLKNNGFCKILYFSRPGRS